MVGMRREPLPAGARFGRGLGRLGGGIRPEGLGAGGGIREEAAGLGGGGMAEALCALLGAGKDGFGVSGSPPCVAFSVSSAPSEIVGTSSEGFVALALGVPSSSSLAS